MRSRGEAAGTEGADRLEKQHSHAAWTWARTGALAARGSSIWVDVGAGRGDGDLQGGRLNPWKGEQPGEERREVGPAGGWGGGGGHGIQGAVGEGEVGLRTQVLGGSGG